MTVFRAVEGIYCYNMMPFGLKNAGTTYQRMVTKVFGDLPGRNVEAYIDDMVINSKKLDHVRFGRNLSASNNKSHEVNHSRYAFGLTGGKFLGFMVNGRRIEASPEKIVALVYMQPLAYI